jgi:formylglycine-generating enzyme required for sulfatase activity
MMGSPSSEKGRLDNEGPQHLVSIKAFKIARYDVTRGQWAAFVAATGRPAPPNDCYVWAGGQVTQSGSQLNPGFSQTARDPVVCVSWNDVQDYLHWLATMTGKSYRLPTEAEWEYAARSGTSSAYYWGDAFDSIRVANNHEQTETVGAHPSNDLGLYDMSGNVWQWLADCYHDSYANAPIDGSAWVSGDCTRRVFRGGSWHVNPSYLRVAARHGDGPSDRNFGRGFRLAQDQ